MSRIPLHKEDELAANQRRDFNEIKAGKRGAARLVHAMRSRRRRCGRSFFLVCDESRTTRASPDLCKSRTVINTPGWQNS